MTRLAVVMAATAALAISSPAQAEKAHHLISLNGLDAGGAESALNSRGFKYIASNTNSMGYTYSYWWHGNDKNCIRTEVYRGRVETIADASDKDCHHSGGSTAAAVGVVAGAALLGALLSHKSHHHDDKQHLEEQQHEEQYERGYTDGLHNAAYHNYDRSDHYADGYQAGVDEREANLSHHHRRGGYAPAAAFSDLTGARAAGAMSELERRGFTQVDNFTSGNARYSIQWRADSRQCLQVITADGHIEDIRDIHTHPNCR